MLPYIDRLRDRADGAENLSIEIRDLITWGIGITTAFFAGASLFLQVMRDRRERRRAQAEDDRLWRIDRDESADFERWAGLTLIYRDPRERPVTIEKIRVSRPRGARVGELVIGQDRYGNPSADAEIAAEGVEIRVGRTPSGYIPGRGPADYATYDFHVRLPESARDRTRAEISVTISDKSRTRRSRMICITTDEITVDRTKNPSVM